jgi:hypothetical protein
MQSVINNSIIRKLHPCYDPSDIGIPEEETLPIKEWIEKYRNVVKDKEDILWLICQSIFMSDKNLRLFAVWCAREALKLIKKPNITIINSCNVAERFVNEEASIEELTIAREAAWNALKPVCSASWSTAKDVNLAVLYTRMALDIKDPQINKLLTYF